MCVLAFAFGGRAAAITNLPHGAAAATGAVTFSGVVQDKNGDPVEGNANSVVQLSNLSGAQYSSPIAADGSFSLTVTQGSWFLAVKTNEVPGLPAQVNVYTTIDLSGNRTQNLRLPAVTLSATVVDSGASPVPNAKLHLVNGECSKPSFALFPGGAVAGGYYAVNDVTTDSTGLAAMTLLACADSPMSFQVTPPSGSGLAGTTFDLPGISQDTSVQVTLYSIYGDLTNSAGDPEAGQTVTLTQSTSASSRSRRAVSRSAGASASTTTDAKGFYGLSVHPATYTLTLSGKAPAGAALPKSYSVSVGGVNLRNGRVQNLKLPLVTLKATVLGPAGTPLTGASVQVPCTATNFSLFTGGAASGQVCGAAMTSSAGLAKVALLPASSATITVTPPSSAHACPASLSGVAVTASRSLTIPLTACVALTDGGFSPVTSAPSQGSQVRWNISGTTAHSVSDSSGMGLFDSGLLAPGASYSFAFTSAGSYGVVDNTTSHKATVAVPGSVTPYTGTPSTKFTVRWASQAPPSGYAADVQLLRPGTTAWTDWKVGTTATSATFIPDASLGTYSFRARLRKTANGNASGWSAPASAVAGVQLSDASFSPQNGLASRGSPVTWFLPASDASSHGVSDSSGMGLFDSGLLAPGASYSFAFTSAGSYGVVDHAASHGATVDVLGSVTPSTGTLSTQFTVRWASQAPLSGYAADVQLLRPGTTAWTDWKVGTTATSATFIPNAGLGTYKVRARLRKTTNGKASGWSPASSISVG
jgi:plastocyanin